MANTVDMRLRLLNRAIEQHPDAAVNYVLRGEYWLATDDRAAAQADFEQAILLGMVELEASDWGYLQQALIDRARQGLRQAGTGFF
ncbi:MAG: hypothetical protein DPW16_11640 [Chloroflexi bacterium]|nr:hypothetical protein [Chloroflexota bacterium]